MSVEAARSCGFRKVGGLYLVADSGVMLSCDRLPYKIENCPVCGGGLAFARGWTWLDWRKYAGMHENCAESSETTIKLISERSSALPYCSVCDPHQFKQPYGLIWVGEKFYSPETFIQEAKTQGISRRIPFMGNTPRLPKNLKIGETWILFAHKHVLPAGKDENGKELFEPAIFYAFCPQRVEMLIWEKDASPERIAELTNAGVTPVIIPDGDKDHDPSSPIGLDKEDKELHESNLLFADLKRKLKGV